MGRLMRFVQMAEQDESRNRDAVWGAAVITDNEDDRIGMLVRIWGRRGTNLQHKTQPYNITTACNKFIDYESNKRRGQGYTIQTGTGVTRKLIELFPEVAEYPSMRLDIQTILWDEPLRVAQSRPMPDDLRLLDFRDLQDRLGRTPSGSEEYARLMSEITRRNQVARQMEVGPRGLIWDNTFYNTEETTITTSSSPSQAIVVQSGGNIAKILDPMRPVPDPSDTERASDDSSRLIRGPAGARSILAEAIMVGGSNRLWQGRLVREADGACHIYHAWYTDIGTLQWSREEVPWPRRSTIWRDIVRYLNLHGYQVRSDATRSVQLRSKLDQLMSGDPEQSVTTRPTRAQMFRERIAQAELQIRGAEAALAAQSFGSAAWWHDRQRVYDMQMIAYHHSKAMWEALMTERVEGKPFSVKDPPPARALPAPMPTPESLEWGAVEI